MTKRECAIVTAYTGCSMFQGDDIKYLYQYLSEIEGREVYTHELPEMVEKHKDKIFNDFVIICKKAK